MVTTLDPIFKLPPIDYSSRDYVSIRNDLIKNIPFYLSEWTDHNASDLGIVILELLSHMSDVLHYYIDRKAENLFLPTAFTREAVIKLLKLIDYELSSASPSTVDVVFSIGEAHSEDIIFPIYTELQTVSASNPIIFELDKEYILPAGDLTLTASAIQGIKDSEQLGQSDGSSYQSFKLSTQGIIDGTFKLFVDEGMGEEEWYEVESFIQATLSAKNFTLERSDDDFTTIFFGDNVQGKIPLAGATLRAEFRVGGGLEGNVGANTIITINDTIYDALNDTVSVEVTNPLSAIGGRDKETVDHAKKLGPRTLRANFRAVTPEDFETHAESVEGVGKAKAFGEGFRDVTVVIAPDNGGIPTIALKDEVLAYLDARKIVTTRVTVVDASYIYVKVMGEVTVLTNYLRADTEIRCMTALADFFQFNNQDFGKNVWLSDVTKVIEDVIGVDHVDFTMMSIYPTAKYSVWSGDATLGEVAVSETTIVEDWELILTSPTTFTLNGTTSGMQINTGVFDVEYISDNNQVVFTITSGATPNVMGDKLTFKTSKIVQNVLVDVREIVLPATHDLTFVGGA